MDALNMTNSDSYESVGSVLGTSTAFGVGTPLHPAAAPAARLQVPLVKETPAMQMIRTVLATVALVLALAAPAVAQTQPGPTSQTVPRRRRARRSSTAAPRCSPGAWPPPSTASSAPATASSPSSAKRRRATSRSASPGIAAAFAGGTTTSPVLLRGRETSGRSSREEAPPAVEKTVNNRQLPDPRHAVSPAALPAAAQTADAPEGIPVTSELVVARCGACHRPDDQKRMTRISYRRSSPENWERTIKRMIQLNKAPVTPEDARAIVKDLSDNHGLAPEEAKPVAFEAEHRLEPVNYAADRETAIVCSSCHSIGRPMSDRRTKANFQWEGLLAMHRAYYPGVDNQPINEGQGFRRTARGSEQRGGEKQAPDGTGDRPPVEGLPAEQRRHGPTGRRRGRPRCSRGAGRSAARCPAS